MEAAAYRVKNVDINRLPFLLLRLVKRFHLSSLMTRDGWALQKRLSVSLFRDAASQNRPPRLQTSSGSIDPIKTCLDFCHDLESMLLFSFLAKKSRRGSKCCSTRWWGRLRQDKCLDGTRVQMFKKVATSLQKFLGTGTKKWSRGTNCFGMKAHRSCEIVRKLKNRTRGTCEKESSPRAFAEILLPSFFANSPECNPPF